MQQVTMKASTREHLTKGMNRRLRSSGEVPAIVYGGEGKTPLPISLNDKELRLVMRSSAGANVLINLELGNGTTNDKQFVIIKNIHKEPLSGKYLHIDFYRVTMDKELKTKVRIETVGTPVGVTIGGILEFTLREISIQCLPSLIPDKITIDVSPLKIRDTVHVSDLKIPEGVKVLDDAHKAVVSVVPPVAEEVAAPTTEVTEPEVIERGKKDEEGAEEGAGEGKEKKPADAKAAAPAAAAGAEKKPAEKKPAEKKG